MRRSLLAIVVLLVLAGAVAGTPDLYKLTEIHFVASGNPTCAAGNYYIWANSTDLKLKKCEDGVLSDLDTGGAGGNHNLLSATHSDTTAASGVRGDFIVRDATAWARLALCISGRYLRSDGTDLGCSAVAAGGAGAGGASQFVTAVNDNAAPTFAQPAFSDLLGSIASTQQNNPGAGSKGGVESITCSGTDKISAIGTNGIPVCSADSTGSAVAFREFYLCSPGNSAAGMCHTFTNLGASFVEVSNRNSQDHLDLANFTDFRILANLSVAAVAGDIRMDCDADSAFGSPATLGTLDNPTATFNVGAWTAIPAGECKTSGGQYMRAGMVNGNGTEDPAVRFIRLQVR